MLKLRVCLPVRRTKVRWRMTWSSRCLQLASRVTHQPTSHLCKLLSRVWQIMSETSHGALNVYTHNSNRKIKKTTTEQYLPVRSLFRESGPTYSGQKNTPSYFAFAVGNQPSTRAHTIIDDIEERFMRSASRLTQIYITKHTTKATDLCWLPPSQ